MGQPVLRSLRPEDIDAVVETANFAWAGIYESHRDIFGPELYATLFPQDTERKGNEMRQYCRQNPDRIWICEVDGHVAGFITWSMDDEKKIGTVGNNGLRPEYAGKGLGSFMYGKLLDHFRANGMHYAKVHTGLDKGHAPARRAYERAGFNIRHESVDYYMDLSNS